jgi:hypothetical protein
MKIWTNREVENHLFDQLHQSSKFLMLTKREQKIALASSIAGAKWMRDNILNK